MADCGVKLHDSKKARNTTHFDTLKWINTVSQSRCLTYIATNKRLQPAANVVDLHRTKKLSEALTNRGSSLLGGVGKHGLAKVALVHD